MNYQYYQNPTFPNQQPYQQPDLPNRFNNNVTNTSTPMTQTTPAVQPPKITPMPNPSISNISSGGAIPRETSYIENILRLNKGKKGFFYFSFPDAMEWKNEKFYGTIEEAGRDHIIINRLEDKIFTLVPLIYLDFVDFVEPINYDPNFSRRK